MKIIGDCETEKFSLEVIECGCGFHLGLDTTYLDQVGPIKTTCPACKKKIFVKEFE